MTQEWVIFFEFNVGNPWLVIVGGFLFEFMLILSLPIVYIKNFMYLCIMFNSNIIIMSKADTAINNAVQTVESALHNCRIRFVVISNDGRWLFIDDELECPEFPASIDPSIMEEMVDAVYNEFGLPYSHMVKLD